MKQLYSHTSGSYEAIMNCLCYYKGDVLCYGEDATGNWFIIGTERI